MKHAKGMTAITNPLVNSYKRLIPGFEAPVHITWSTANRNPLIRIPAPRGEGTRIELRSPDPSANPYLTMAVCLAAGLEGIRNQTMPPESLDLNSAGLSEAERTERGIESLPGSLWDAVKELEKDAFIREVLGDSFVRRYAMAKKAEWNQYCRQVTEWELEEYLYRI